jgi:hypothetical protein
MKSAKPAVRKISAFFLQRGAKFFGGMGKG